TVCFGMILPIPVAIACIVLADSDRRYHAFAFADIHDANATGGAAGDADVVNWTADQRAAVGDEHDLVALQHWERRHDLAAVWQAHQFDAFAAASGHAVLVGRGAFAETR